MGPQFLFLGVQKKWGQFYIWGPKKIGGVIFMGFFWGPILFWGNLLFIPRIVFARRDLNALRMREIYVDSTAQKR